MSAPWQELGRSALRNIAAHRLRSFLTVLGIIIGVFAVVSVVSVTGSLRLRLLKDLRADRGRVFNLSPWSPAVEEGKVRYRAFDAPQVQELKAMVPELQTVSPRAFLGNLPLKHRGIVKEGFTQAVDENGLDFMNVEVAHGRVFLPTDRTLTQPVVVLGPRIASELGLGAGDVGKTITLGGQTAELVGILARTNGMFAEMVNNLVLVPFGSFKGLARPGAFERPRWTLFMDDSLPVPEARERVRTALRRIRGLRASDPDNFTVRTNEQATKEIDSIAAALMAAAGGMVGISLLVGGIGVMNIMLVTVTERTREIGLRKSLGARRRDVLLQFLVEAGLLCGLGGLVGLVLGVLLGDMVGRIWIKAVAGVPLWALLSAFLGPVGVGLVFGLYPARKAARLDPIEALRYE